MGDAILMGDQYPFGSAILMGDGILLADGLRTGAFANEAAWASNMIEPSSMKLKDEQVILQGESALPTSVSRLSRSSPLYPKRRRKPDREESVLVTLKGRRMRDTLSFILRPLMSAGSPPSRSRFRLILY